MPLAASAVCLLGVGATLTAWNMISRYERQVIERQVASEAATYSAAPSVVLALGLTMSALTGLTVGLALAARRRSAGLEARVQERTGNLHHINEVLREREEQISTILNAAAEGIFGVDEENRCTFCNESAARMLRCDSSEELIGRPVHQLILRTRPDGSAYPVEAVPWIRVDARGGLLHHDDEVFWRMDDTCFAVEYWCRPLMRGGVPRGCIVSFIDISRRRLWERQLEEKNAQLSDFDTLFQISTDMLCIAGADGFMKRVNPAFSEVLGHDERQLLTTPIIEFVHPDDRAATEAEVACLAADHETRRFENRYRCRDGSYRWLSWSSSARGGRFFATARDVTEQKQARHQLEQAAEDLARSNSELEQFAYVASHDLQEPLRTITSHLQIISAEHRGKLSEDADVSIDFALDASARLRQMIQGLLQYSRVKRNGAAGTDVDLDEVLEDILASLSETVAEAGAKITRDPLPVVRGDALQLGQLLQNLICNALKFRTERPPRIHISCDRGGDGELVIKVRDNGIGMDCRYGDRIFELFQRLHRQDEYEGAGIGLALCRRIVERHGGRIWFESDPGQGATFLFTLSRDEGNDGDATRNIEAASGDSPGRGQPERRPSHEASAC